MEEKEDTCGQILGGRVEEDEGVMGGRGTEEESGTCLIGGRGR